MTDRGRSALRNQLAFAARISGATVWLNRALWIGAGAVALAIGAAGMDALFDFPAGVRMGIGAGLLAAIVVAALMAPVALFAARVPVERAGRILERRRGLIGNEIVNALQLERSVASDIRSVTGALAERAVRRGRDLFSAARFGDCVDLRRLRGSAAAAGGALLLTALLAAAAPRFMWMEAQRFIDPDGNHAPYSPTIFEVTWTPSEPLVGDDVTLSVSLGGIIPRDVAIVVLDDQGRIEERLAPSALLDDRSDLEDDRAALRYVCELGPLRSPLRFFVEATTGRTRIYEIAPLPRPRVRRSEVFVQPPDYTGWTTQRKRIGPVDAADAPATSMRALAGSQLRWEIETTLPLGGVGAEPFDDVRIEGAVATLLKALADPGSFVLAPIPRTASGYAPRGRLALDLVVAADAPPQIDLPSPPVDSTSRLGVARGDVFSVRGVARDDVAIRSARMEVRMERDGSELRRVEADLYGDNSGAALVGLNATVDTGALQAETGDILLLTVAATDGRPDSFGGRQETVVGPIRIEVVDPRIRSGRASVDGQRGRVGGASGDGAAGGEDPVTGADKQDDIRVIGRPLQSRGPDGRADAPGDGDPGRSSEDGPAGGRAETGDARASGAGDGEDGRSTGVGRSPASAESPPPPGDRNRRPAVMRSESASPIRGIDVGAGVSLRDVPPAYRDVVSAYLLRVAAEEAARAEAGAEPGGGQQ